MPAVQMPAWSVSETRQIPEVLTTAIRTALTGRPGPVFVEIPVDLLMTMVEDTVGRHDTLAGNCSREINVVRYGRPGTLSCRDNFIKALGELGMGARDIPANINFFMHVPVDGEGRVVLAVGAREDDDPDPGGHQEASSSAQELMNACAPGAL